MFELREATLESIRKAFASGELTSLELTMMYMQRIADIDQSGPTLKSVIEINPDAIDTAEALDREYAQKGPRGPLHGIPVLIKDNISTGDKMHTSAGSLALADNFAGYDAFIVKLLREAGAVILGKTNMSELANYLTDNMRNGYSSRGGACLNPYGENLDVGGSSAGSAAAVAANLCAVAVGTETSGSILCPANWNSVVGIKPTKGLISRTGIIPICAAQDTAGPIARTVTDAAELLNVLIGTDPEDPVTNAIDPYIQDYTKYLVEDGLRGMRIGVSHADDYLWPEEHRKLAEKAYKVLEESGAELVEVNMGKFNEGWATEVLKYEFKTCFNAYLASCPNPGPENLLDVINFNNTDPERCLAYGQAQILRAQLTTRGSQTEPEYLRLRINNLTESRKIVDDALRENNLDCIVMLAWNDIPPLSGYPAIAVPIGCGAETNHPIGFTFVGTAFAEPKILRAAYGFEQLMKGRVVPEF